LPLYDAQRIEKGNKLVLEKIFETAIGYCPVTGKQAFDARIVPSLTLSHKNCLPLFCEREIKVVQKLSNFFYIEDERRANIFIG